MFAKLQREFSEKFDCTPMEFVGYAKSFMAESMHILQKSSHNFLGMRKDKTENQRITTVNNQKPDAEIPPKKDFFGGIGSKNIDILKKMKEDMIKNGIK